MVDFNWGGGELRRNRCMVVIEWCLDRVRIVICERRVLVVLRYEFFFMKKITQRFNKAKNGQDKQVWTLHCLLNLCGPVEWPTVSVL